jgi:DGQHR domain-containing protein
VYRGYARLCDLARISKPDIYDRNSNPSGTQRDLSPKHARDAYDYVKNRDFAFWPEVFLCARNKRVISFSQVQDHGDASFGTLTIRRDIAESPAAIAISRIDGNHRLHYADGRTDGFPPVEKEVSFCLAYGLTGEQEITLFRDINDNQKKMNTSHLENIQARLTPLEKLKKDDPALFIAQQLGEDKSSPFLERIYQGGVKEQGARLVPLKTMKTGIQYMLSRPTKLTALRDADAEYRVIRNYFSAVKRWIPDAWQEPRKYVALRGSGLWAICFIGAEVIDRVLARGEFKVDAMLEVLKSGTEWDWSNLGSFQGLGGRGGALKISNMVTHEFRDPSGVSIKSLSKEIMQS